MFIINTTLHMLGPSVKHPEGAAKNYRLRWPPGMNEVKPVDWDRLVDDTFVQGHVDRGDIEVFSEDSAVELAALPVRKAIKMIKATFDSDVLATWAESEGDRPGVFKAIEDQIEKIEAPNKE